MKSSNGVAQGLKISLNGHSNYVDFVVEVSVSQSVTHAGDLPPRDIEFPGLDIWTYGVGCLAEFHKPHANGIEHDWLE